MDEARSPFSQLFSLLFCVALFAGIGALLWGFGYWMYYDPVMDGRVWDWEAMNSDTKDALIGRLKFGSLGGCAVGVIAFSLSFLGRKPSS